MRFRPPYLLVAGILQAGLLLGLAQGGDAPTIRPEEAPAYEGQGEVRVVGLVAAVHPRDDQTRIALQAGSHRLDILVREPLSLPLGSWVEATGRVARLSGALTLIADAGGVSVTEPPGIVQPAWADLAERPDAWTGQALRIRGTIERGALADGDGHRVALGPGPWPASGPVEAMASLAYEPSCLCHRLWASSVARVQEAASAPSWEPSPEASKASSEPPPEPPSGGQPPQAAGA